MAGVRMRGEGYGLRATGYGLSIALLGLGACRAEAAETGSAAPTIAIPKTWTPAPEIANAMKVAGLKIVGADAWAERAMGCYAASLVVDGGGEPEAVAKEITGALGSGAATEIEMPAPGVVAFKLDQRAYHGRVRTAIDRAQISMLACFWNDREPAACEAACEGVMGSVK